MSAETLNLVLSAATLVVVAAAAVAAIVQLRHLRQSNQIDALLEILNQWNQPALQRAYVEFFHLAEKLADPAYLALLNVPGSIDRGTHPEFLICDFWEQVGTYTKHGLIDERILLDVISAQVANAWTLAEPLVTILRSTRDASVFENFEYLAVRSAQWSARYPQGTYPSGVPRMAELKRSS
ncbi:MAG TPA: hypothetical protein VJP76_05860 [Candidatus Tumulicola sp.]|nr:hypothetical protein [Candidatus Tumulicola sp.]